MDPAAAGRYGSLHTSFKLASRALLTSCSREDFNKFFPSFTDAERGLLYRMFTTVMKSLHSNIEPLLAFLPLPLKYIIMSHEDFDAFCQEEQVAAALDKLDEFVERQNLDVLSSDKVSIEEVKEKISRAKKDKIEYLTDSLRKVEENNNAMKAQIELLKKEGSTPATDLLKKMTQWNSAFLNNNDPDPV
ncbi:hypothetical protein ACP70R_003388 [Stipagrostis hirtigluma subsp. patula]